MAEAPQLPGLLAPERATPAASQPLRPYVPPSASPREFTALAVGLGIPVGLLMDRYGPLPQAAAELVAVARLRVLLHGVGVREAVFSGNSLRLSPVELPESRALRIARLYPGAKVQPATRTIVVPQPRSAGLGVRHEAGDPRFVEWVTTLVTDILVR